MKKFLIVILLSLLAISAVTCDTAPKSGNAGKQPEGQWLTFDQALANAQAGKKYIAVDFYTDWCKWCKVMDQKTYSDPAVQAVIEKNFVLAKVNPEKDGSFLYKGKTYTNADLAKEFNVQGFPTTVYLDRDGNLCGSFAGFVPPESYVKILNFIANGDYKKQSLDDFTKGL